MNPLDWLRPPWRHSDPEVRIAAVRDMGPMDQARLESLARKDPDARVRRAAIKKLDDAPVLEQLASSEPDEMARHLAAERAQERRVHTAVAGSTEAECAAALAGLTDERSLTTVANGAAHESIRQSALSRITNEKALRAIARDATDAAIRRAALARISDPTLLRGIAVGDGPVELALLALAQITDIEQLRAIADHRGAAKAVRQKAQSRLPAGSSAAPNLKSGRARQLELCAAVEHLRVERNPAQAAAQARALQDEWTALAATVPPLPPIAQRFATATRLVLDDAGTLARQREGFATARAARSEGHTARITLCERVEALDGPDLPAGLAAAKDAWNRLPPLDDDDPELARRFANATRASSERHQRRLALEDLRARLTAIVEEAEAAADATPPAAPKVWQAIERRFKDTDQPAHTGIDFAPYQRRFTGAAERWQRGRKEADERRGADQLANVARLEKLLARLQALVAAEPLHLSHTRRELQAADAALKDLGPLPSGTSRASWTEQLTTVRDELRRRFREVEETEDWRRWANVAAQEELIRRVDELLETNDPADITRQLGTLQDEWSKVASAPADKAQALWERFRAGRQELRKRSDAYLTENLEKKRALCAQVADVGDATNWNETAELIKRLQAEWKDIGPAPQRQAQALWQQFREPCDRFFARRAEYYAQKDTERQEASSKKLVLCERAEALADSTDWDATTTAMKRLQSEWKDSGPLPRAQGDALWQRFRTACDRFFDRRNRRDELEHEDTLRRAAGLCDAFDGLLNAPEGEDAPTPEHISQRLEETWGQWLQLDGPTLDGADELRARVHAACERIAAAHPDSLAGTKLDPAGTHARREKLCQRMESLIVVAAPASAAPTLQEMALALRERLATNTIAGAEATANPERTRDIARLVASWAVLGPALDETARTLTARFDDATARASATDG